MYTVLHTLSFIIKAASTVLLVSLSSGSLQKIGEGERVLFVSITINVTLDPFLSVHLCLGTGCSLCRHR